MNIGPIIKSKTKLGRKFAFSRYFRRHNKKILLTLVVITCLGSWAAGGFIGKPTKANVLYMHPSTCLGSWNNTANAQNEPDQIWPGNIDDFSDANSAKSGDGTKQIFCGNFSAEIPSNAGLIGAKLKLVWVSKADEGVIKIEPSVDGNDLLPIDIIDKGDSSDPVSGEADPLIDLDKGGNNEPDQDTGLSNSITPQEPQIEKDATPTAAPTTIPESSSNTPIEDLKIDDDNTDVTPGDQESSLKTDEQIITDENNSDSQTLAPVSTFVDSSADQGVSPGDIKIRYSLDGNVWYDLVITNYNNLENEFALPINSFDNLQQMQISIESNSMDTHSSIYLDGMELEAEYELIDSGQMIDEEKEVPDFSTHAIKQDVSADGLRVVLLEMGGMQELWYTDITQDLAHLKWIQLVGDGRIDNDSPLGTAGKNIFWLDKNRQNIFSFSLPTKSIRSVSIAGDEFQPQMQFLDSNGSRGQVVWDQSTNTFQYLDP